MSAQDWYTVNRPPQVYTWAVADVDNIGDPIKSFPPSDIARTGLLRDEPWVRVWHNQMVENFGRWIQHMASETLSEDGLTRLGGFEPVGTTKFIDESILNAPTSTAEVEELWGGQWARATGNVGGKNLAIYTKTAN